MIFPPNFNFKMLLNVTLNISVDQKEFGISP